MRYVISLTLVLTTLWLAISGVYKPPLFALGAASVALVVWLSRRMDVVGVEHNPVLYSWRMPVYWGWLIGQIIKANFGVVQRVVFPKGIRPRLITVPVPHQNAIAKVTYANSCTLTPGTVALHLTEDELTAHVLDDRSAASLEDGTMARRVQWLENAPRENRAQ